MQLNQISPTTKQKKKKRVGRGGKRGTYSGRGIKGQKARAGARIRPAFRDILKQLPKKRGYKFKSIERKPTIVNIRDLDRVFKDGDIVSPKSLVAQGLISKYNNKIPTVKILGEGKTKKKFIIQNCLVSESARKKLEKVGGSIN